MANGVRVLNLFGYTGGFSLYAARGGALRTTTVDISPDAIDAARENFGLNGLDPDEHEFVVADVFEYLANDSHDEFGVIVCDPPSLARRKEHLQNALRAYTRLNTAGLRRLDAGGLYAASSCSSRISVEDFRGCLATAAQKARRRLQIVRDNGQPVDHPVGIGHPEGRYLKFLMTRSLLD
jgi:23S rRNA (cytosine1962-C5)-methyltransferase